MKQHSEDLLSSKVCDILETGPTEEDHRYQRTPTEKFSIVYDIYAIGIAVESASIVEYETARQSRSEKFRLMSRSFMTILPAKRRRWARSDINLNIVKTLSVFSPRVVYVTGHENSPKI
jgi:hypothetical protein